MPKAKRFSLPYLGDILYREYLSWWSEEPLMLSFKGGLRSNYRVDSDILVVSSIRPRVVPVSQTSQPVTGSKFPADSPFNIYSPTCLITAYQTPDLSLHRLQRGLTGKPL